jgi:hypothetical protein
VPAKSVVPFRSRRCVHAVAEVHMQHDELLTSMQAGAPELYRLQKQIRQQSSCSCSCLQQQTGIQWLKITRTDADRVSVVHHHPIVVSVRTSAAEAAAHSRREWTRSIQTEGAAAPCSERSHLACTWSRLQISCLALLPTLKSAYSASWQARIVHAGATATEPSGLEQGTGAQD